MRKILKFLYITVLIFSGVAAYGEQEDRLSVKKQYWDTILYYGNDLKNGDTRIVVADDNKKYRVISNMSIDNGIPAGDFKLFSISGYNLIDGKGKWEEGMFEGKIKIDIPDLDINGEAEGKFAINLEKLFYFSGKSDEALNIALSLYDGEYKTNVKEFSMRAGRLEGKMTLYNKSGGKIKEENYKEGKLNGKRISYWEDGDIKEEQNYKDGKLNGESLVYSVNYGETKPYLEERIEYKNGKMDGVYTRYSSDGGIIEKKTYRDGLENGPFISYESDVDYERYKSYDCEEESECEEQSEREDSNYIDYYVDGGLEYTRILEKGSYKNGRLNGEYVFYNEWTDTEIIRNFKNGVLDGEYLCYSVYKDRWLKEKGYFKDGKENGRFVFYSVKNVVDKVIHCKDGLLDGEYLSYSPKYDKDWEIVDSYLSKKIYFKNGKPQCRWTYYDEDGKVITGKDDDDFYEYWSEEDEGSFSLRNANF